MTDKEKLDVANNKIARIKLLVADLGDEVELVKLSRAYGKLRSIKAIVERGGQ